MNKRRRQTGGSDLGKDCDPSGSPPLTSQDQTLNQHDSLPDDLDITKYVGPYQFPSPRRRRTAAYSIFAISLSFVVMGIMSQNNAMIGGGSAFILVGAFFFFTAWTLKVKDLDALTGAAAQAPFSVGHASAQLSFTGWLSKPLWRVVVFSSDEPPTQRGLVEIDAVNETIASTYFDYETKEGDEPNA